MSDRSTIHIGNHTALSAPALMVPFEYALANGFDAFEWFPDGNSKGRGWNESQVHPEVRARIRSSATANRVRLSVPNASINQPPQAALSSPSLAPHFLQLFF